MYTFQYVADIYNSMLDSKYGSVDSRQIVDQSAWLTWLDIPLLRRASSVLAVLTCGIHSQYTET